MAHFLALLAFSGLIAAQFLAAVFARQYRAGLPSAQPEARRRITLIRRAA